MSHFDTPHTVFVIGCGESAKGWFNHDYNLSIGVNDCLKFSRDTDYLVLIDSLHGFKNEPERVKIISQSKAKVLSFSDTWRKVFPKYERLRLQGFGKHLKKGHVYSSKSSPFVAASVAFNMGAKDIVLFGIDMKTHQALKEGSKLLDYELRNWERFTRMMAEQGTQCWVSSEVSVLSKFLPVWKSPVISIVGACDKIRREMQELVGTGRVNVTPEEHIKRMLE